MKFSRYLVSAFALAALLATGCGKKDDAPAAPAAPPAAAATAPAAPTPPPEPAKPAAEASDYVRVLATHAKPKPTDPVVISVANWKVTKAAFDPANLEGGSATIELDLASLSSDSAKRDKHLKSSDYLDIGQFGTAVIEIGEVKKSGDQRYDATAKITAHGITMSWPVQFEVLETMADKVRIKGTKAFSRLDFKIGSEAEDSAAPEITIELQLTLSPQA